MINNDVAMDQRCVITAWSQCGIWLDTIKLHLTPTPSHTSHTRYSTS